MRIHAATYSFFRAGFTTDDIAGLGAELLPIGRPAWSVAIQTNSTPATRRTPVDDRKILAQLDVLLERLVRL